MISNMANLEVYKRRNASAPFVARDDRWNDTENDLNNDRWLYIYISFSYKRDNMWTGLTRVEKTFMKLKKEKEIKKKKCISFNNNG